MGSLATRPCHIITLPPDIVCVIAFLLPRGPARLACRRLSRACCAAFDTQGVLCAWRDIYTNFALPFVHHARPHGYPIGWNTILKPHWWIDHALYQDTWKTDDGRLILMYGRRFAIFSALYSHAFAAAIAVLVDLGVRRQQHWWYNSYSPIGLHDEMHSSSAFLYCAPKSLDTVRSEYLPLIRPCVAESSDVLAYGPYLHYPGPTEFVGLVDLRAFAQPAVVAAMLVYLWDKHGDHTWHDYMAHVKANTIGEKIRACNTPCHCVTGKINSYCY